ncbi:hypothetical protein VNI00_012129 [Paramarasmius palmivorus]|uniref:Uncharacterized protein n=1 Tax=Paramarasmius palmivorus TaxID=297713 RepID=A0AAW0C6V0_9AGAR
MFTRTPETILVDMNFDTIPRGRPNVLCLVRHHVQDEDVYGETTGIGTTWRRDTALEDIDGEAAVRVEWTSGGHGIRDDETGIFHRFIMYDENTSENAIRRALASKNAVTMKRISIPRPPPPPSTGYQ